MVKSSSKDMYEDLARAVYAALGPVRVLTFNESRCLDRALMARGCVVLDETRQHEGVDAVVVMCALSGLEDCLSSEAMGTGASVVFACVRTDGLGSPGAGFLRESVEAVFIKQGFIKHPAMIELLGYGRMDEPEATECWAMFEHRPLTMEEKGRVEHEVWGHDMLRVAGVRSDSHLVRYQIAATLIRPGDTVLDAACGLGYGSHVLASLSPAARINGIDLSDWVVDFARRNYASDRVDFRCGSLPDALDDVPDASVDFVVSLETLEHVTAPQSLLAAFDRVLKPGGRIFVSVPNDWADETGEDPNPHHLHVYDWARVRDELAVHFVVESVWSLTASGCKTGADRVWRPQPRKLEAVTLEAAATAEGEWWLVCASKSPLAEVPKPYDETIHTCFEGSTHLVDFAEHYDRPWLVHSMVELPWRIRDKAALLTLAQDVVASARQGSADLGAGLAVTGWRVFEDEGPAGAAADGWLARVGAYLDAGRIDANPHVRRWCVSLDYLRARFLEARGDAASADAAYRSVMDADVLCITPTLGTKQADAALRAGVLAFREGRADVAVARWQAGMDAALRCMQADALEFVGNRSKPFIFAMNDLVEIADGATRLGNAIRAVTSHGPDERMTVARQLGGVTQRSLRSALGELQTRVGQLSADLDRHGDALASAQALAGGRGERIQQLQTALDAAQALAHARADEVERLAARLDYTQAALEKVQILAAARSGEIAAVSARLDQTQASHDDAQRLAIARASEVEALSGRLDQTQAALEETQRLAVERDVEARKLQEAVDFLQGLVAERDADLKRAEAAAAAAIQHRVGLEALVADRDARVAELTASIEALTAALANAEAEARASQARHSEVINSRAWRAASALGLTPKPSGGR